MEEGNLNIKTFICNPFRENCYLVWDDCGDGVLVDPGCYDDNEVNEVLEYADENKVRITAIWLTHAHFDHVFGVTRILRRWPVKVYMSPDDKMILEHDRAFASGAGLNEPDLGFTTTDVHEGDELSFAGHTFKVMATPGHTPGGVCYYSEADGIIFTGDTLFAGSIGRTDTFGGDYDKLIVSVMDKVMGLPGSMDVLPGHGHRSTIADERTHNPFLQPFNEPGEEEDIDWDEDGIELNGNI